MTKNVFKVGDIIRGKRGNGYTITSGNMTKGRVVSLYGSEMKVKVLELADGLIRREGSCWTVDNDIKKFELVEKEKTKETKEIKKVNIKLDSELEIEKLQNSIKENTTEFGVLICKADLVAEEIINQTSEISNFTNYGNLEKDKRTVKKSVKYYLKDNTITCVFTIDGDTYIGKAKCSPEDEFNFKTGIKLSEARAKQKRLEKQIKELSK